jgi:hypothetical protein
MLHFNKETNIANNKRIYQEKSILPPFNYQVNK